MALMAVTRPFTMRKCRVFEGKDESPRHTDAQRLECSRYYDVQDTADSNVTAFFRDSHEAGLPWTAHFPEKKVPPMLLLFMLIALTLPLIGKAGSLGSIQRTLYIII